MFSFGHICKIICQIKLNISFLQQQPEVRLPLGTGIAGHVATTGNVGCKKDENEKEATTGNVGFERMMKKKKRKMVILG